MNRLTFSETENNVVRKQLKGDLSPSDCGFRGGSPVFHFQHKNRLLIEADCPSSLRVGRIGQPVSANYFRRHQK